MKLHLRRPDIWERQSLRGYQLAVQRCRDGVFPRGEEDGEVHYPLLPHRRASMTAAQLPVG